ncbi:ABC transporter permease subunit [Paenibacillus sp. HJL G12]|uniref:ABC transporter permease subunit n=1 Tax=Paenibacillus dendrobii TaxID=2691084 RepID=A0A7X3LJF6_9BACL|nr:ABC transporter permease subunit [Paenibacillus dendrobii]MWV47167.1 ABC transporter permease subunit [Paenibacillus dendrobii]
MNTKDGNASVPILEAHTTKRSLHRGVWSDLKRDKYLYVLGLPGIIYFLLFKYIPFSGLIIAFENYSPYLGILKSQWVGFEHFQRFFSNDDFYLLLRNTLAISLLNLLFFFPFPIILSLLLNEVRNSVYKRVIQSIVYIPHFFSWVIIAGLTYLMLSQSEGLVNELLEVLGMAKIGFLTNSNSFWMMLTAQSMWKEAGWGTIIFLAAIAGVDPQLSEAATVDGAGRFRKMWHITLPAIRNIIMILLILQLGSIMDTGFEQVYLMTNGAVSEVSDVFDTYVYRSGIQQGQFSYSTAVGLFKSVVGVALICMANFLAKRFGQEGVF